MTTTIKPQFQAAEATDLAPVDSYTCVYSCERDGKFYGAFKTIKLIEPAHPSQLVRVFSDLGSDLGFDPTQTGGAIVGQKSGFRLTYAREGASTEEALAFASTVLGFSNTKATARRAKRALKKGFGA